MNYKAKYYRRMCDLTRDQDVLDVGSVGQNRKGTLSDYIREGAHSYKSIDIQDGADIKGDMETADIGQQFDVIVCADIIEHVNNQLLFLQNCKRHLRNWGNLIIVTPDYANFRTFLDSMVAQNKEHTLCHNWETLKRIVGLAGLNIVHMKGCWKSGRKMLMVCRKEEIEGG